MSNIIAFPKEFKHQKTVLETESAVIIIPTMANENWLKNCFDLIAMIICVLLVGIGIFNIIRYFWG